MLDVDDWPPCNSHRITIFPEETGTEYKRNPVHIDRDERFNPVVARHAKRFLPGQSADTIGPGVQ